MPTDASAPAVPDLPVDVFDAARLAQTDTLRTEWVLTNALGGFAMGTILGVPTRKYHGCLVAAMAPPVRRVLAVGPIAERLTLRPAGGAPVDHHLCPFHFAGSDDRPERDERLVRFERSDACLWVYELPAPGGPVRVERRLHLIDGRNAAVVEYKVETGGTPWSLELRPLTPLRDFHDVASPGDPVPELHRSWSDETGRPWVAVATKQAGVTLSVSRGRFVPETHTWDGLYYWREEARGQDAVEDVHAPGAFVIEGDGRAAESVRLLATIDAMEAEPAHGTRGQRRARMVRAVLERCGKDVDDARRRTLARLACAADAYVVKSTHGGTEGKSIIAGYPWFSDWGRDSMIALPGLLLVTGRHAEAFGVLETFANARKNGLIPNRFDDDEDEAHYNTADASLWFIHAACLYYRVTADREGFFDGLVPACEDIVQAHKHGTDYNIGADPADGLVHAGNEQTQLTWMDARRDGVTFTPRHGKPVEINALWHNALASLASAFKGALDAEAAEFHTMAARVARSFRKAYAGGPHGGLVDCLFPDQTLGWRKSTELRPNQIFAASLTFSPLDADDRRQVIQTVGAHLLTPVGLRTLAPDDPGYRPRFEGAMFERDGAYHNGTVWPWLLGPYVEATLRVDGFSAASRGRALALLEPLARELDGTSVGQVWEVYDADEPRRPDGCIAQAWSVAELLRVMTLAIAPRVR